MVGMPLPEGLTHRPLTVDDAPAVFELWAATERRFLGQPLVERSDVADTLAVPSVDLDHDSVGVLDGDRLVAWAMFTRGNGLADVGESHAGRGIGTWLVDWFDRRTGSARVGQEVHVDDAATETLLAAHGYAPSYTSWVLDLAPDVEIPRRDVPAGFETGALATGEERAVHEVVESAFAEWGQREPMSYEDWDRLVLQADRFRPERVVVCRRDGEVVGACVVVDAPDACWVWQLAVRAEHRGRGLAQAMMARAFTEARGRGKDVGRLATDSRTGALGLYEKLGLQVKHEMREWVRPGE